jgi:hypothetical protein
MQSKSLGAAAPSVKVDAPRKRPFGFLPDTVTRDPRVSPEMLVVIAYRCTIAGDWVLREVDLKRIVKRGLGEGVAGRAISGLKKIDLISRWQEPGLRKGTFGKLREVLNLPTCSRADSPIVWRAWFDGTLTMEEMAALIYLRAGIGRGRQETYARELVKRFRWSRPTATKIITALLERDLLEKVQRRDNGMFAGITYGVPGLAADKLERSTRTTVKKPGNGMPGNGSPDNGSAGDLHTPRDLQDEPPTVDQLSQTLRVRPAQTPKSMRTARTTGAPGKVDGSAHRPDRLPPSTTAEQEWDKWQAAREALMAVDHARALDDKLLTEAGIRPYLKMLEEHGNLARQVMFSKLIGFAIDGVSVGQVQSWKYFHGALRDTLRQKQMAEQGLRPGDLLGNWRNLSPEDVPF